MLTEEKDTDLIQFTRKSNQNKRIFFHKRQALATAPYI